MPGLVNVHAHTPMLLLRGTGAGLPTDRWLTEVMWPREGRLVEDDVESAMLLGASELLLNGITTTTEMYFFGDAVARSAAAAGIRCLVTAPLIEASDFSRFGTVDDQLAATVEMRHRWSGHPLIEVGIGPHAAYSLSRSTLERVVSLVDDDSMLVHIHVAEQPHEGDAILAETGLTVPAYLDEIGLLGQRTIAAHCVWLTEADIELFAARGVSVAHCPVSNGRHASGIAPIVDLRSKEIRVGIGTDGPASHDRLDLFDDMRTAIRLSRLREMDASALPAETVLGMSTHEAASAVGRADIGRLVPGYRADFLRVDVAGQGFVPDFGSEHLVERVVWLGSPDLVRDVWVEGRQVVDDRRCITVDRVAARSEVQRRSLRLIDG
jgi:5-methylthioadenosine/S-adenosylhomocysteine deaminase